MRKISWSGLQIGLLTLSDSRNQATDQSGAALEALALEWGATVMLRAIMPDDQPGIQDCLVDWADDKRLDLIVTTGGTGPGPRDVTPEATRAVCQRELPGFAEQIRAAGLAQTRNALLTRGVAAFRGQTFVINLPGSTRGAVCSLEAIADLVPHAVRMARGGGHH
ncbi:MAG: MogA/MoaB family molybdenum cofactor biosynthesis protein [Magnetococcales bacterium]|nr:MogA/MoaB family molybdenum cofactor biosynthesis protein [Magnetococcales bacterium]